MGQTTRRPLHNRLCSGESCTTRCDSRSNPNRVPPRLRLLDRQPSGALPPPSLEPDAINSLPESTGVYWSVAAKQSGDHDPEVQQVSTGRQPPSTGATAQVAAPSAQNGSGDGMMKEI